MIIIHFNIWFGFLQICKISWSGSFRHSYYNIPWSIISLNRKKLSININIIFFIVLTNKLRNHTTKVLLYQKSLDQLWLLDIDFGNKATANVVTRHVYTCASSYVIVSFELNQSIQIIFNIKSKSDIYHFGRNILLTTKIAKLRYLGLSQFQILEESKTKIFRQEGKFIKK